MWGIKRKKCWLPLPALSAFPTLILEAFFTRDITCQDCVVKISPFTTQSQLLTTSKKKLFENIVGKDENAGNQHFLCFSQSFLLIRNQF